MFAASVDRTGMVWPDGTLKAPMPYFGGKHLVASVIWSRLGTDVANFIEPFFGSGAVLLARPGLPSGAIETVNDADGMVSNFWRAIRSDPDAVARDADWPCNENDLHGRHRWLVGQREALTARLEADPDYCEPKIAGWWVWGLSLWIGGGWCRQTHRRRPYLGGRSPGQGVQRKIPDLYNLGRGVHREGGSPLDPLGRDASGSPLGDAESEEGKAFPSPLPGGDSCANRGAWLRSYFRLLADRLRSVRVCSGDWTRVVGSYSATTTHGTTAVFLDPPYAHAVRDADIYAVEATDVSTAVREWALGHGDDPAFRICLAGYVGEHAMPASWESYTWSTSGGYGVQGNGRGRINRSRECLWFSPHCKRLDRNDELPLFAGLDGWNQDER